MSDNELPKVLDVSVFSGSDHKLPQTNKYNILRDLVNRKTNVCWTCPKLGTRCCTVHYIFSCNNVKQITNSLNKEDYYYDEP